MYYNAVIYFSLFGFCGWVCETIFCSINQKKVVNRGFLSGPICPVYGFGGLIVIYILAPLRDSIPLLFLFGMVAATTLEYVTSFVLEKLFSTRWWDYSDLRLNIHGRVCLQFSLIFGVLSVVAVKLLHPPFAALVAVIPVEAKPWITWGCLLMFTVDCVNTVHTILSLNGRLAMLKQATAELREKLEAYQPSVMSLQERLEQFRTDTSEHAGALRVKIEELAERWESQRHGTVRRFRHRRLMDAFPNMKSTKYQEQFAEAKAALIAFRDKTRKKSK